MLYTTILKLQRQQQHNYYLRSGQLDALLRRQHGVRVAGASVAPATGDSSCVARRTRPPRRRRCPRGLILLHLHDSEICRLLQKHHFCRSRFYGTACSSRRYGGGGWRSAESEHVCAAHGGEHRPEADRPGAAAGGKVSGLGCAAQSREHQPLLEQTVSPAARPPVSAAAVTMGPTTHSHSQAAIVD